MAILEATLSAKSPASKYPPVWPVVGAKGIVFGSSAGVDDDVRAIQQIGTKSRIARNATIFTQGDSPDHAYKVVNGVVRLCKHMSGGRRHIAQFLYPGDFFSVMESDSHSFTAEAVTDVVLTCYAQSRLAALSEERPGVGRRFFRLLTKRLFEMENHLTVLGRQTAKERVISFLLSLPDRDGLDEDNLVDVAMNRQDIADYLGLTNETVCRVVSELKRAGLIDVPNNHQFVLNDMDALQALVDSEEDDNREPDRKAA